MNWLDRLLNRVTMYRLTVYVLSAWLGLAVVLGYLGIVHLSGTAILVSTTEAILTCWAMNHLFARTVGVSNHGESGLITALILALIVPPSMTTHGIIVMFWTSALAMAGKFIITWHRQHLFNPAALAVAITAATINSSATWWISNTVILPFVAVGGYLIIRKLQKEYLVLTFMLTAVVAGLISAIMRHVGVFTAIRETVIVSPLVFFATVMLTEPSTMPGTKRWRYIYAGVIGLLFTPQLHVGGVYSTPELALLSGNFLGFIVNARQRFQLTLVKIEDVATGVRDFVFSSDRPIHFRPGQYLELMVKHPRADGRGQRRYFTIASAPSDRYIRFGVKFYDPSSSYKLALWNIRPGETITAAQLGGDFTLPSDTKQPLVFIAGGIGITPFRSMVSELLRKNQSRPMTLLYSANGADEFAYGDIFNRAAEALGMRVVPTITNPANVPASWSGRTGIIDPAMITAEVPGYAQHTFYLSGPQAMVNHFKRVLKHMGVGRDQIKTDFFPGFA